MQEEERLKQDKTDITHLASTSKDKLKNKKVTYYSVQKKQQKPEKDKSFNITFVKT